MANNPYVNKVVFGDEVLIDTSEVTVDETSLEAGRTALNAAGALITGTRQFVSGVKGNAESTYRTGDVNLTPANIGAVDKSGDVMTGDLRIKINCDTIQQDNGVTTAAVKRLAFVDNNGAYVGEVSVSARPDGATVISLASANKHSSQGAYTYESSITIIHSKDGTITYSLSDPAAFRTAISVKRVQTAVNSPTVNGTAVAFIDTISQDTQGVITATKKTVANASTRAAGLMSADDKTKLNGIANGATANTGTVTSIATGSGLTGGTITDSGTVKANLTSETKLTNAAADGTETAGRVYPVRLDKNGKLAVNVPWVDTNTQTITGVKGNAESTYRTGNVNLTPANIGLEFGSVRNPGTINNTALFGTFFAQGSACTGLPTSDSKYYAIAAFGVYQIAARFTANGPDCIFTRYYVNDKWYPWTSSQMQSGWLPSGTSIDDVNTPGTYGIVSSNTYTGLPPGVTGGILEVIAPVATYDTYVIQRMNAGGSNIYQRYRTLNNGTAYSSWYRYFGTAV